MGRQWMWALMGLALASLPAAAQMPGPGNGPFPGALRAGPPAAQFFLANTGVLKLTDQQVTRLAAIARRAEATREAMRARLDSLRANRLRMRADSGARGRAFAPMAAPAEFAQLREQQHADLRDALAVLTPDQLATAWELRARAPAGRVMRMGFARGARSTRMPGAPARRTPGRMMPPPAQPGAPPS